MRRIGIIGLDTSHAPQLARYFNAGPGAAVGRVTCAWPGGSPDAPLSVDRVAKFTREVRDEYGVKILRTPEAVATRTDALLLLAMDGRMHAELFRRVARRGRPIFINKPLATSVADATAIARVARERDVPWFSASALRFVVARERSARRVRVACPLWFEPANAGWCWYGVHGVEMLSAAFGPGAASVRVAKQRGREVFIARWHDGRVGRIDGVRSKTATFKLAAGRVRMREVAVDLAPLERAIGAFVGGGRTPVNPRAMTEVVKILAAANASRVSGGATIYL